jgi:hypothetical protein
MRKPEDGKLVQQLKRIYPPSNGKSPDNHNGYHGGDENGNGRRRPLFPTKASTQSEILAYFDEVRAEREAQEKAKQNGQNGHQK